MPGDSVCHCQVCGFSIGRENRIHDQRKPDEVKEPGGSVRGVHKPSGVTGDGVYGLLHIQEADHGFSEVPKVPDTERYWLEHVPVPAGVLFGLVRDVVAAGTLEEKGKRR